VWNAARVFHGRTTNWPGIVLGGLAWVAAITTLLPENAALRMTIGAGIVALYAALTANELWSERRRKLQKKWPAVVVPVLHGFVLMLPILLGDFLRADDEAFATSIWVTAFAIELVLYAVGTVFIIFMLVSERTVSVHKTAASIDPLTGMFNRRGFTEATARMIEREAGAGRPVTVMIFDIDHFKSINDRFGHEAGDRVLVRVAALLLGELRQADVVVRTGGEEFVVLMPRTGANAAAACCERLRAAIGEEPWDDIVPGLTVTASVGLASTPDGAQLDDLASLADDRLYAAKRAGRDRVVAA
jgi:diguanylate cyclase (GGDEF)-like protein